MRAQPLETGIIHFVGIGGIGMSGIAEILHVMGYQVQGSDLASGANVERLRKKNILIFEGHDEKNVENAGVIVVSSAVGANNPELVEARKQKIPVVRRAEMLAELMRLKWAIAIGGTHGKTTTTSMVGAILEEGAGVDGALDPTVINGGIVNRYGSNTRLGKGRWMVAESDESDGTFTRLPATVSVVTNIDAEHMEHYGDFDAVRAAYKQFIENIPFYGFSVLCIDDAEVQSLVSAVTDRRLITYGFNPQADLRIRNVRHNAKGSFFDIVRTLNEGTQLIEDIFLSMPGDHNVQNAAAAIAIGLELGVREEDIKSALQNFSGVKRRFTLCGEVRGIKIFDDYGHHPVEIAAVLKTARQVARAEKDKKGKVIAVMQPHRYSRLQDLFDEFSTCFNDADCVIITDIYAAGEDPIENVNKEALVESVRGCGHKDVRALKNYESLPDEISSVVAEGDVVILLGAGDITKYAHDLPAALKNI